MRKINNNSSNDSQLQNNSSIMIYISSVCAQKRFDRLVGSGQINCQFQNQKFHHLLLSGLASVSGTSIDVISFYPQIRRGNHFRKYEEEIEDGILYRYPAFLNYPIIQHLSKFLGTIFLITKRAKKDSVIICNIMNFDECRAALFYRRFHRVKVYAIVADVPGITSGAVNSIGAKWKRVLTKVMQPFYYSANNKYDGYLFLTEAMNEVVNTRSKPYVVMEGIADSNMLSVNNVLTSKNHKRTILYAGGLHREYGIQLLVEAFKKITKEDVELHIYGKGNYVKELEKEAEKDSRIKYYGTRSNQEIVIEQVKAHILINPRPTNEDFVKYSFPSKIMECMASGTPLLTTRLPGMPKEYYTYIYTIDNETVDGVSYALQNLLNKPLEELHRKGQEAKAFIIKEKNSIVQASKLDRLIKLS